MKATKKPRMTFGSLNFPRDAFVSVSKPDEATHPETGEPAWRVVLTLSQTPHEKAVKRTHQVPSSADKRGRVNGWKIEEYDATETEWRDGESQYSFYFETREKARLDLVSLHYGLGYEKHEMPDWLGHNRETPADRKVREMRERAAASSTTREG